MARHEQLTFDFGVPAGPESLRHPVGQLSVQGNNAGWDFVEHFPCPLPGVAEAGIIDFDDEEGEGLRAIHHEHARECLATMAEIRVTREAIADGVSAETRRTPRAGKEQDNCTVRNAERLTRLEHGLQQMLDVYTQAFGDEALAAFQRQLEIWEREGMPVERQPEPDEAAASIANITEDTAEPDPDPGEMPCPRPLDDAIARKAFGEDESGDPVCPGDEEVQAITKLQADRLRELLDVKSFIDCRMAEANEQERAEFQRERYRVEDAYLGALALYAEDFGEEAARILDGWVRNNPLTGEPDRSGYPPSHPWHYYHEGDGQPPVPVDSIVPAGDGSLGLKLPKSGKQREAKLAQILADQEKQLAGDKARYVELAERGVEALSVYDRTISSGGNEPLALASALALKYNHVANGLARVSWLRSQIRR